MDYSALSKDLTNSLPTLVKKNNGIYFTPPACVINNIELLQNFITDDMNILEPSCGSCEYITALHRLFPNVNITGIEYNKTIYESIVHLNNDKIVINNMNYLHYIMKLNV